ncbi:MAG: M3 family oligoendopeptidase [Clostridia bacterium]|nr:M3 family oligoendopeptidase [Clostridia bacterium]
MKVKDLPYKRYTVEEANAAFVAFESGAALAGSADEVLALRRTFLDEMRHYETNYAIAYSRFTLNTRDEFYQAEMDYYNEVGPEVSDIMTRFADIMLASPFRAELEAALNPRIYKSYEISKKAFSPEIIEDSKRENALVMEYSKLMSEMQFEFKGESMPLSVLRGKLSSPDRDTRRDAACAIGEGLSKNAASLDRIYDELVKIRDTMAKKMGYKNFVELGYYRMGRCDYDADMVKSFRDNVAADIVPTVSKIKREIADRLGYESIKFYDNETYTAAEEPKPILDTDGIMSEACRMYDEMSTVTGKFMREMLEAEAFDVESRDGKWGGGYCISFPDYKQAFILANFNGTSADLDVITHEFGHALADHYMFEEGDVDIGIGGMETAECHSMSMEFFAYPYMQRFCGNRAELYKLKHMLDGLSFIPYGVIVDEFQHIVYENPNYTPEERKAAYRALEEKYRPYLDYDGIPYLSEGTRWQYQAHIYESPFYYIDYCLAQTVAFGFLVKSLEDYGSAFESYLSFVKAGGSLPFGELVSDAGIKSPFEAGALADIAKKVTELKDELLEKIN